MNIGYNIDCLESEFYNDGMTCFMYNGRTVNNEIYNIFNASFM